MIKDNYLCFMMSTKTEAKLVMSSQKNDPAESESFHNIIQPSVVNTWQMIITLFIPKCICHSHVVEVMLTH